MCEWQQTRIIRSNENPQDSLAQSAWPIISPATATVAWDERHSLSNRDPARPADSKNVELLFFAGLRTNFSPVVSQFTSVDLSPHYLE
jgi:hypothetical protein